MEKKKKTEKQENKKNINQLFNKKYALFGLNMK